MGQAQIQTRTVEDNVGSGVSNFFDEIAAKLATLSGSATPKVSLEELNEFDVRDIQAVRVSEGGGGGGGNVPFVGVDPPDSPTDGMLWWDPDDDTPSGSQPGAIRVETLDFAFDTPGLDTGVTVFTPVVGERILDCWVEVLIAFDGDQNSVADVGVIDSGSFVFSGLFAASVGAVVDLSNDWNNNGLGIYPKAVSSPLYSLAAAAATAFGMVVPIRCTSTAPLSLVMNQDGTVGGSPVTGGSAGAGTVVVVVAAAP